jgi:hypothetical protein
MRNALPTIAYLSTHPAQLPTQQGTRYAPTMAKGRDAWALANGLPTERPTRARAPLTSAPHQTLTASQISQALQVSRRTVYRWRSKGYRGKRLTATDVLRFLARTGAA